MFLDVLLGPRVGVVEFTYWAVYHILLLVTSFRSHDEWRLRRHILSLSYLAFLVRNLKLRRLRFGMCLKSVYECSGVASSGCLVSRGYLSAMQYLAHLHNSVVVLWVEGGIEERSLEW